MSTKDKIKNEIDDCIKSTVPLLNYLEGKSKDKIRSFHHEYQIWYSKALRVVQFLAPDRFSEFKSYYEIDPKRKTLGFGTYVIQDYLKGVAPGGFNVGEFDVNKETLHNLYNQYTILKSVYLRIDSLLNELQTNVFIELQDLELATAKTLTKINVRSAGVIAGVILEAYLQKVVLRHKGVSINQFFRMKYFCIAFSSIKSSKPIFLVIFRLEFSFYVSFLSLKGTPIPCYLLNSTFN